MPQTATIAQVSLTPGTTVMTTITPAAGDTKFSLALDRTVTGGLNATVGPNVWAFRLGVDYSPDGGATWPLTPVQGACEGVSPSSVPQTGVGSSIPAAGSNRMLRAWFTVPAGVASLAVQGSFTTS